MWSDPLVPSWNRNRLIFFKKNPNRSNCLSGIGTDPGTDESEGFQSPWYRERCIILRKSVSSIIIIIIIARRTDRILRLIETNYLPLCLVTIAKIFAHTHTHTHPRIVHT